MVIENHSRIEPLCRPCHDFGTSPYRGTRASSADGSTKALLLPKIDANRGRERDTRQSFALTAMGKVAPWNRWPSSDSGR
jgi:hypothetical protein